MNKDVFFNAVAGIINLITAGLWLYEAITEPLWIHFMITILFIISGVAFIALACLYKS